MTQQMACCKTMQDDPMAACDNPAGAASGVSLHGAMSCYTTTLVGGRLINSGLTDTDHTLQKLFPTVEPVAVGASCLQTSPKTFSLLPFARSASPPAVEKYISNASLLI